MQSVLSRWFPFYFWLGWIGKNLSLGAFTWGFNFLRNAASIKIFIREIERLFYDRNTQWLWLGSHQAAIRLQQSHLHLYFSVYTKLRKLPNLRMKNIETIVNKWMMWRSLMKQGLKNSFNKNYLWVTIAGTNMVDHDSDINLFVYFSYNLLLMRKRFSFCDKKMLGYITQRVLSIAMISINFTVKLDWLAKLLHGNSRGSNTESGLSENWEAEYWIYYWDKLSNQLKEQIYLILR